jgi:hypothetical protein
MNMMGDDTRAPEVRRSAESVGWVRSHSHTLLLALGVLVISCGCAPGKYAYVYDRYDARPDNVHAAAKILAETVYLESTLKPVDLNDLLWVINDCSKIALEVRGPWLPEYNDRLTIFDVGGSSCSNALWAVWGIYKLRPDFHRGRIILTPERGPMGSMPELL